ncbi:hypothetical protein BVG79_01034 [Ketogulonicigenium robustum]|uniref:Gamma-glutamyl kinase n=1 Tax=Ketogulonicigenium robustum TaxID=92947 RepID=A0A1W6NZ55_9RHOB|nr:sulfotransferase family 2 domain-containing protein [Ketogulonicigenium robustum]ARO14380.1 hypothetical protein BVG79_01034 [Ketogulonicigenium robustum]
MLVFWQERLVMLAVPKTGTTSLEEALAPRAGLVLRHPTSIKHMVLQRYQRTIRPMLENAGGTDFETLTVVREPVSWLSSWYRYRHRDALVGHPNSTRGVSFDYFVTEYLKPKPAAYASVGQQARYVFNSAGERKATHLFRYENQPRLVKFLEKRLRTKIDLPRVNVSPELPTILSPDVEAELRAARPLEFAAWDLAG